MTAADLLSRLLTVPDDGVPYVDWMALPDGLAADLRAWRDGAATTAPTTGAKGCRGCRYLTAGGGCWILSNGERLRPGPVSAWIGVHTEYDACTPLPGAPECPGREEVSRG